MGYFLNKFGIKPFNEAEADGRDLSDPNATPTDYAEEPPAEPAGAENTNNNQQMEEPPIEGENNNNNNPVDEAEPTTDYTEDIGDDNMEGEAEATGSEDVPSEDNAPVNDIKNQEEEILQLTPEELDIKHKELKNQFLNMYDIINSVIDRINDVSISEDNIGVVEYISDTLSRMKTMLSDYVESVYRIKSYTENSINYNRFLTVLNGINKLLEEIDKKNYN